MISRWNDAEAGHFDGDLGQRVYTFPRLGRDPTLGPHGGGNTSVKTRRRTLWGELVRADLARASPRVRCRGGGVPPQVLGTGIRSVDVAGLVTAMWGPAFAETTGAQVPIDGGNERAI